MAAGQDKEEAQCLLPVLMSRLSQEDEVGAGSEKAGRGELGKVTQTQAGRSE